MQQISKEEPVKEDISQEPEHDPKRKINPIKK